MQTELARSYLSRKVEDPALREALTPDYPVGCKRPLMSRQWYPTLTRPNVRLVTEPITEITEHGLVTADGEHHRVDTIIYGTGFRASEFLTTVDVVGTGGRHLHDQWRDGAEAYLGLSVAGFPNFFMLYGPNTNGVNSILFFHEAQSHYVMAALSTMRRFGIGAVDVRRRVIGRYNRRLQARHAGHGVAGRMHQLLPCPVGQGGHPAAPQRRVVLAPHPPVPGLALPAGPARRQRYPEGWRRSPRARRR